MFNVGELGHYSIHFYAAPSYLPILPNSEPLPCMVEMLLCLSFYPKNVELEKEKSLIWLRSGFEG